MKKDELLRHLRDNEAYKQILSSVPDEKERRAIKVHTENFMLTFLQNIMEPLQKIAENDPNIIKKSLEEFQASLINSGSKESTKE